MKNTDALAPFFYNVTYVVTDIGQAADRFSFLIPGTRFTTARITPKCIAPEIFGTRSPQPVRLECAMAPVGPRGEYEVRLLQPLDDDPIFHRFATKTGGGLHHIAFRVPDLETAAKRLAGKSSLAAEIRIEEGYRCLYFRCEALGALIELNDRPAVRSLQAQPPAEKLLASYFTQVAYIVNDIGSARSWVENVLGCEIAAARDIVQGPSWNLKFRGRPAARDFGIKMVIGKLGPDRQAQIELLEPERNDNVLAEFLHDHGPGLNHVAFMVPDYNTLTAPLRSTGVPPLKEIHVPGTVHSSYFDCSQEELATIEVFETGPHA
ncbi:MAG TPA: VOC family protein [Candidatus Binataceae bacterium]|nr:VOC family protein [Candidatus Binataceae bacterium]